MPPGRVIGEAMNYLLDVRLDEGLLGDEVVLIDIFSPLREDFLPATKR